MRLFVALVPPPAAVQHLADEVGRAPALPVVRAVPPDRWHLTLAFLGEVPDERVPAVEVVVGSAAEGFGGVVGGLRLAGGGTFDGPRGGRSGRPLWVGVRGAVSRLVALADEVRAALAAGGLPYDPKPFRPHVTLGRLGSGVTSGQVRSAVGVLEAYEGPRWPVEEVRLVRSVLGAGARHETLRAWRLGRLAREVEG